jgi:aspartate/tyrosine/aromatic aminotransferase
MNLASSFLARFPPTANGRSIYVPNPTLPEDLVSLKASGMEIRQFRFLDQRQGGIDWEGLREDLMVSNFRSMRIKLILLVCSCQISSVVTCQRFCAHGSRVYRSTMATFDDYSLGKFTT